MMSNQNKFNNNNNNNSLYTPQTPDSAGILIANAGSAANERRGQKNIMNCFRDRTPSYTRSNTNLTRVNANKPLSSRPVEQVFLKEPRPRPIKLTLLKSSSTRDLSRLYELDAPTNHSPVTTPITFNSSSDLHKMTTSSSSSGTSYNTSCSSTQCVQRLQRLELKIEQLERQLLNQEKTTKTMATQVQELCRKFEQFSKEQQQQQQQQQQPSPTKPKKSGSVRLVKKDSTVGATVQPSKLAAWLKLSNFWKQRPSIQTLKEQNIYNDEPCFDTEIELVLKDEVHKTVPKIVVDCCQLIEDKYRKSTEPIEGIYRQCGDYNKMQALRFSIDANDYMALRQTNVDIHTLAGVLKLFLREIKSPLVSTNEAKTFIGKPNQWLLTDLPGKLEILKRLIRSLPEVNRDTMEYLFAHFNKLTKVPLQHISAETLSLSVTPSIFHSVQTGARIQDIHLLLKESEILADCVKIMIEYHQKIFECPADRKQQRNRISVRNLKKTLSHPDLLFQNLF